MTGRLRRLWAALAAVVLVGSLGLVQAPAQADREDEIKSKIADAEADLDHASETSVQLAAQLRAAESALPAAEAAVRSTQAQLEAARAESKRAVAAAAAAVAEQRRAEAEVVRVLQEIADTEEAVGLIARRMYQGGGIDAQWATVLEAGDPGELAERIQAVRTVGDSTDARLTRLSADQIRLEEAQAAATAAAAKAQAERQKAEEQEALADKLVDDAKAARQRAAKIVADRDAALAAAKADEAAERARLAKLKAEQKRLAEELARLAAQSAGPGAGVDGELAWPAAGGLSQGVGPRVHPVYGYPSCHTGIDISSGYGSAIKAAAAGTVALTSYSPVWGNYTLVSHGGGLVTMYAHQSAFKASPGDKVAAKQVIGYVGSTGYSTGPHLHFEVHVNGIPYNPMGWFGGIKAPVVC